jgi:hypothetical protein
MSPNGRFMASSSINREKDLAVREYNRFSDAEGLRLMQAFFHITEREQRRRVIALAEELASQCGQRTQAALPQDNDPTK